MTYVTDEEGNELSIDDLKGDMHIRAFFGPAVTCSIQPNSSEKIVVIAEWVLLSSKFP